MGKVLKIVAVVAIAAAITYFAPTLGGNILAALGTSTATTLASTVATAFAAAALSVGVSLAFQAVAAAPSGIRRPTMVRDASGLRWIEEPPSPPTRCDLHPIEPAKWWWAFFWPRQQITLVRLSGNCLDGSEAEGARWAVVDRNAAIQPGGFFAFDLTDLWTSYVPAMRFAWFHRRAAVGMIKRYLGADLDRDRIIYECTNPHVVCDAARENVRYAYAVAAYASTWWGAVKIARGLQAPRQGIPEAIVQLAP